MKKELNKLGIGGEMRPVHFGFATLADWCDMCKMTLADISKLGDNMPISTAISMVFCGLKHGARKSKEEFKYSVEDVADWLDDDQNALTETMEIFTKSMGKVEKSKKEKGVK